MYSRNICADKAYAMMEDGSGGFCPCAAYFFVLTSLTELPLFNPTRSFSRYLELFELCGHNPTITHPVVVDWASSEKPRYGTSSSEKKTPLQTIAADILSETGIDMAAFGNALAAIQ